VKATGASADADSQLQRFVPTMLPAMSRLLERATSQN